MMNSDLLQRSTIRLEQCGGRPCSRGMRIRVIDILELLAAGESPEQIPEDYPYLEPADITASLVYAARRMDHPNVAAERVTVTVLLDVWIDAQLPPALAH